MRIILSALLHRICNAMQLDPSNCFVPDGAHLTTADRPAENDIICSFLAYVVRFPRGGTRRNTENYAPQVLASVRSHYEDRLSRRLGLDANGKASGLIRAMQKGLRKLASSAPIHRMPVLQHHLRL